MPIKTIGILMPGDMGHGCGKFFLDNKSLTKTLKWGFETLK